MWFGPKNNLQFGIFFHFWIFFKELLWGWTQRKFNFFPPLKFVNLVFSKCQRICQFGIFKISNNLLILNFQNVRIIWFLKNVIFRFSKSPKSCPFWIFKMSELSGFWKMSFSDFQNSPKVAHFGFSKCQNYLVFKMSFSDFQNPPKNCQFGIFKMSELSGF